MIKGSGSEPRTNGSGWPKNIRILRIRIRNTEKTNVNSRTFSAAFQQPAFNDDQNYGRRKSGTLRRFFTKNTNLFRPPCLGGLWQGPRTGTASARTGSTTRQTKFTVFYFILYVNRWPSIKSGEWQCFRSRNAFSWLSFMSKSEDTWNKLDNMLLST